MPASPRLTQGICTHLGQARERGASQGHGAAGAVRRLEPVRGRCVGGRRVGGRHRGRRRPGPGTRRHGWVAGRRCARHAVGRRRIRVGHPEGEHCCSTVRAGARRRYNYAYMKRWEKVCSSIRCRRASEASFAHRHTFFRAAQATGAGARSMKNSWGPRLCVFACVFAWSKGGPAALRSTAAASHLPRAGSPAVHSRLGGWSRPVP